MPRGVPKAGFRKTKKRMIGEQKMLDLELMPETRETDAQIEQKLADRFEILETLTQAAIDGDARALIVSGPAGLGKSYTVEDALANWDPDCRYHTIVKGYVKATGLYKLLYQFRNEGQVIVFDDADSIFFDDIALNMLKAACDTTETRRISYLAEFNMVDEDSAELIPRQFEFNGTIIFISNIDFDAQIEKGNKLASHMQAMISRSHYIDLAMKTRRDYMIRIKQVVCQGLLSSRGLNDIESAQVMDFVEKNQASLRELSLRIAIKVANLRRSNPDNWEKVAKITCCKM
jgi:hypothetical protein